MIRRLAILAALIVLAAGVLVATVIGLMATEPGTRWLFRQIVPLVPGHLSIARVEGSLLGPLVVRGLDYRRPPTAVSVQTVTLTWRPADLLRGQLRLTVIDVDTVHYTQAPSAAAPAELGPLPSIDMPLEVVIERADVTGIEISLPSRHLVLDRVHLALTADRQGLHLGLLELSAPNLRARLQGTVLPRGDYPLALDAEWQLALAGTSMAGHTRVQGDLKRLELAQSLNEPFQAQLEGVVELHGAAPQLDVSGHWQRLQWPLTGPVQVSSAHGTLHVSGQPQDYRLDVDAAVSGKGLPPARAQLVAQGNRHGLDIEQLEVALGPGRLSALGPIAWAPALEWQLSIAGNGLDPALQWPAWPGTLTLQLHTSGSLQDRLRVHIEDARVSGQLRGYPLAAEAALTVEGGSMDIARLQLASGSARLQASGQLAETWKLDWEIRAPQLNALLPDARGAIDGAGSVRGPWLRPRIVADLQGRELAFQGRSVQKLSLDAAVDLSDAQASRLELQASGVQVADHVIEALRLDASGTMDAHRLQAALHSPQGKLEVALRGQLQGQQWRGSLIEAALDSPAAGQWHLAASAALEFSTGAAVLQQACFRSKASATLCAAAAWRADSGWNADAELKGFPVAALDTWLPDALTVSGTVEGTLKAASQAGRLTADARIRSAGGRITYQPAQREQLVLGYREVLAGLALQGERLTTTAKMQLVQGGGVSADITLAPLRPAAWRQAVLAGRAEARFTELGLLTAFVPAVADSRGVITANIALAGTLENPRVIGQVALEQGAADVVPLGIQLRDLQLALSSQGGDRVAISGQATSGPGTLHLRGTMELDPAQGWPLQATLQGERFEVADLAQAHVLASPELTVAVARKAIDVGGTLRIPTATVTLQELPARAVRVSDDLVIVDAPKAATPGSALPEPPGWRIESRIKVMLGDKVRFRGFGISTRLTGSVLVTDLPGQMTVGEGVVNIAEGEYRAYGQELKITQGRILFAGPITNPALQIEVAREVDDVTAGIRVTGTPRAPQVAVFSKPAMAETDALAYLLLGSPMRELSGAEGKLLLNAVSTLGLAGGEFLAQRIGQTLGLQDVEVKTGNTLEEASLLVGRYLSPRLYIGYGLGLFDQSNTFRVRYKINRRLTLQAETGAQQGADLLYTIEF